MAPTALYAIGLKGWVQIRRCVRPPVRRYSEATHEYEVVDSTWEGPFRRNVTSRKTLHLKQVNWEGGRILTHLPTRSFNRHTLLRVKLHQSTLIPPLDPIVTFLTKEKK